MTTGKQRLFEAVDEYRKENRRKPSRVAIDGDRLQPIARILKETYDWMDSVPFDGWVWEIMRRTATYQKLCRDLIKALPSEGQSVPWLKSEPVVKLLHNIVELGIRPMVGEKLTDNEGKLIVVRQEIGDSRPFDIGIPEPSCEYREFRVRESFVDLRYFRVYTYEKAKRLSYHTHINIETLHVGTPEDTIYVGVSRFARKADLRELCKKLGVCQFLVEASAAPIPPFPYAAADAASSCSFSMVSIRAAI
jgi:hypothetical protein